MENRQNIDSNPNEKGITEILVRGKRVYLRKKDWHSFDKNDNKLMPQLGYEFTSMMFEHKIFLGGDWMLNNMSSKNVDLLFESHVGGLKISVGNNTELITVRNEGWKIIIQEYEEDDSDEEDDDDDEDDEENVMRALRSGNGDRLGF